MKDAADIFFGKDFRIYAHRASYLMHIGPLQPGEFVCHRCDNRKCVRPDHLFAGTIQDNFKDMVKKGRQAKGTRAGTAKLNDDLVREIRKELAAGKNTVELGNKYGVSNVVIGLIRRGRAWRHVS